LGLGLFQLSPVEAPFPDVSIFFWRAVETELGTSRPFQCSLQYLMSEVLREFGKATAEQSFEDQRFAFTHYTPSFFCTGSQKGHPS